MRPEFHQSLAKGIELFNRREFYEAHEAWEEGWLDELSDHRLLLQGLIQVAAGFYKLQVASPIGTVKLLEQGLSKLRRFTSDSLGVDLEQLVPEVERWHATAKQLVAENRADYDPSQLPKIEYMPQELDAGTEPSESRALVCPYCGEKVELVIERAGPPSDLYVEDCPVCCRPWTVSISRTDDALSVRLLRTG